MALFTITDFPDRVVFEGDLPQLDYTSYTIYKNARESIKQYRNPDLGLKCTTYSGEIFNFKYDMFAASYNFQDNTDLRLYLEALI